MNRTIMFLLVIIFAINFSSKTQGRRDGAPCSAVEIMTPNHGRLFQNTSSRFRLEVEMARDPIGYRKNCYVHDRSLRSKSEITRVSEMCRVFSENNHINFNFDPKKEIRKTNPPRILSTVHFTITVCVFIWILLELFLNSSCNRKSTSPRGYIVDPLWIHRVSTMDPWWIHVDSWTCDYMKS